MGRHAPSNTQYLHYSLHSTVQLQTTPITYTLTHTQVIVLETKTKYLLLIQLESINQDLKSLLQSLQEATIIISPILLQGLGLQLYLESVFLIPSKVLQLSTVATILL